VTIPDVATMPQPQARSELVNLCEPRPCLVVRVREVRSDLPEGFVAGTEPPSGTQVPRGSTVTMLVAVCLPFPFPCTRLP
jgi:beta-lactam-binding protein with PASTA domain